MAAWCTPVHGPGLAALSWPPRCPLQALLCQALLSQWVLCRGNCSSMSCLQSAWRLLAWDLPESALWICGVQGSCVLHVPPAGRSPSPLVRTACPLAPNAPVPLLPDATSPCAVGTGDDTFPSFPLLLVSLLSLRQRRPLMF